MQRPPQGGPPYPGQWQAQQPAPQQANGQPAYPQQQAYAQQQPYPPQQAYPQQGHPAQQQAYPPQPGYPQQQPGPPPPYGQPQPGYAQPPQGYPQGGPGMAQPQGAWGAQPGGPPQTAMPGAAPPAGDDFDEDASWTHTLTQVILHGKGLKNPRSFGLGFLGISIVALVANVVCVYAFQRYFVFLAFAPGPLLPAGLFLVATNAPKRRDDGQPTALWARVGLATMLLAGLPLALFFIWFFRGG